MSVSDDVKLIFEKMPDVFIPDRAKGVNATIQIELSGEGASTWLVKIDNGTLETAEGKTEMPTLKLIMAASDYVDLIHGRANPIGLFAAGKVKLEGDMGLALKFQQMFDRS